MSCSVPKGWGRGPLASPTPLSGRGAPGPEQRRSEGADEAAVLPLCAVGPPPASGSIADASRTVPEPIPSRADAALVDLRGRSWGRLSTLCGAPRANPRLLPLWPGRMVGYPRIDSGDPESIERQTRNNRLAWKARLADSAGAAALRGGRGKRWPRCVPSATCHPDPRDRSPGQGADPGSRGLGRAGGRGASFRLSDG